MHLWPTVSKDLKRILKNSKHSAAFTPCCKGNASNYSPNQCTVQVSTWTLADRKFVTPATDALVSICNMY